MSKVRVRFAPSPTGGLHLGGVRTALFNYLFAHKHHGEFVLRIEDTDQSRYVEGAEQYIIDCLTWCGLNPDEGPHVGGPFVPYRQSERKESYRRYAEQLVNDGYAYYAFDTPEDLEAERNKTPNFRYGHGNREHLKNSLTLSSAEVATRLQQGVAHVIRIKMPADETVVFNDAIRGHVSFDTNLVDDKVLLKADGMPTYHLAVVVDDYLMEITHALRGEEWLPSAPVHILLWEYLGWKDKMPQWVHLPLILKPDGNGKLSKRDGDRLGFPVYAMNWTDPKTGDLTKGFRELGFLPEAFINMLALLSWNDGTGQELFTLPELIEKFSLERISKSGAKFDFEKAKWFNQQYLHKVSIAQIKPQIETILNEKGVATHNDAYLEKVITLVKDRLVFLHDFWDQSFFFFEQPKTYDFGTLKTNWTTLKSDFFESYIALLEKSEADVNAQELEAAFKSLTTEKGIKVGEVMLPLRIMLVGGKFGPGVFDIVVTLGISETVKRIKSGIAELTLLNAQQ